MFRYQEIPEESDPIQALEKWHEGIWETKQGHPWRVSNAYWAINCPRRLLYQACGYPQRKPAYRMPLMWDIGHRVEGKVLAHLVQAGHDYRDFQKPVLWEGERGLVVTGSMDTTTTFGTRKTVIDIKTMGGFKHNSLNPRSRTYGAPMTEAVQVNLYAYLDKAPLCGLMGFSRDTLKGHLMVWEMVPELAEQALEGFQTAWDALQELKEPNDLPRGFGPKADGELRWECGYCAYATNKDEEKKKNCCWPGAQQYGIDPNKLR